MIGPLITEGYLSDEDVVNPYSRKKRSQSHASDPKEKTLRKSSGDVTLLRKYERGQGNNPSEWKEPSHKRLRTTMQKVERNVRTAIRRMVRAELLEGAAITQEGGGGLLEATEPGEKTYTLRQDQLVAEVDAQSARKRYDLHLPTFGPYVFGYSKNGNALSLLGQKGHLATIYWKKASLQSELQLKERCTDVTYLHDDRLLAVAQKKYTYIYSAQDGTEVHQLRCMAEVVQLEFLPEHFLLCGANRAGLLSWFDVSTGKVAGTQRSRMGTPNALRRDPSTNVLGVAHTNGTVTFWSPKVEKPLVRLAAHRGPVLDMSFDLRSGSHYLATVGCDARTRIWDLRTMMPLHHLTTVSGTSVDLSYTGLLAVGFGHRVEVWKDLLHEGGHTCPNLVRKPYMAHNHDAHTTINYRVRFCPYEDVLGVSHTNGFSSFLIPGAGCAVPDFYTADVFESRRGKAERPVQMLLDKLSPDMISWETKFPKQELAESGAMTAQRKKREARQRRRAARDAREVNEEESWEVQPKDLETRSISSDDSSDMDTTEEKDIEKVLSDQIAAEDKDSTRLRDTIRVKRERRLRRLEGTKRFQVLQRRKGRHTIRLTRRRVRKETESREGTRGEVGDGISQNTVKRPATKIRNLAMERFKKKK